MLLTTTRGKIRDAAHVFVCTVLLSRRLYPHADNHRLGTLAKLHALPSAGRAHRALADAEVTANLLRMQRDVQERYADALRARAVSHALLAAMQQATKGALGKCVAGVMHRWGRCSRAGRTGASGP